MFAKKCGKKLNNVAAGSIGAKELFAKGPKASTIPELLLCSRLIPTIADIKTVAMIYKA